LMTLLPSSSTLFPYTTLFRSSLPRLIGVSGYLNGSDIQLFIPRSRSDITKISVWNCSAKLKASCAISKHSDTEQGMSRMPSTWRSEEHTSELQSLPNLVCRLL